MKFVVNIETLEVRSVPENQRFDRLPHVRNNGQHYQLPGHVLAEYQISGGELLLWHPETSPQTGHVDIYYRPFRRDGVGVAISQYIHHLELNFGNEVELRCHWPSGGWHLISTIVAIERHMAEIAGYQPRLENWVSLQFKQSIGRAAIAV